MLEDAKLLDDDFDNQQGKRSWGTFITVNNTSYATSLFWQPLQNTDDPFQEVESATEGVLEGADLFCIKSGKAPQFGICVSYEGFKNGDYVAAVSLSTAMSDYSSFVAVFKTKQGWWYTCVRNDIILSDGDMLFLSEEEAKEQFTSMLAVPDWNKKIAPAEWNIEETEPLELSDVLSSGAKAKLQKIKGLRGAKLVLVLVVGGAIGLWLLSSIFNYLFLTPTVRPVMVPVKPKVIQMQKKEVVIEIKPWEKIKDPMLTMNACYTEISNVIEILPPGWNLGDVLCSNGEITASWSKTIGRMLWVKKSLDNSKLNFNHQTFSADGNSIFTSLSLPNIPIIFSMPEKKLVDLRNELNDTFQSMGHPIGLGAKTETSQAGTVYKMLTFSINSRYNPKIWEKFLSNYSGLVINTIKYSPSSKQWDYQGVIYVL